MLCIPSRFTNVHSILLLLDLQPPVFLLALLHAVLEVDVEWGTASVISYVLHLMTAATTLLKCHASQVHTDLSFKWGNEFNIYPLYYNVEYILTSSHVHTWADITVGFAMPSYTVNESVGDAMLTVTAEGDFPSAALQSQLTVPVEAVVLIRTQDLTAEGELGS